MQDAIGEFRNTLLWAIAFGLLGVLARFILPVVLRPRLGTGLAPLLDTRDRQTLLHRMIGLIGMNGRPIQTLDSHRLPASPGVKLVTWGLVAMMGWYGTTIIAQDSTQAGVALTGIVTALAAWIALRTTFYEIRFDRDTITLPHWFIGRSTHRWRDLVHLHDAGGWMMTFHFADGSRIDTHKFVVGYPLLMETARKAMREE